MPTTHAYAFQTAQGVTREAEEALQRGHATLDVLPRLHIQPRIAQAAQEFSKVGVALAHAETLNACLQRAIELCYSADTDGRLCNVDRTDYRLLFPAPWGKAGGAKWGLRRTETDILRACLYRRMTPQPQQPVPLFMYDSVSRAWHVNLQDYATQDAAQAYVARYGVSAKGYKSHLERIQQASAAGRRKVDRG